MTAKRRHPTPEPDSLFWREAHHRGFTSVFAMDFEGSPTTGVVEYGIAECEAEGVRNCWSGLCAPKAPVPTLDTGTHGLRDEELRDHPPFGEFWELFRSLRQRGPFLAHAAGVEERFLSREWSVPGTAPDWLRPEEARYADWGPWLDSLELFRSLRPDMESRSLASVITGESLTEALAGETEHWCPPNRNRWHCALYDAIASALLFIRVTHSRPDWGLWAFRLHSLSDGHKRSTTEQTRLW